MNFFAHDAWVIYGDSYQALCSYEKKTVDLFVLDRNFTDDKATCVDQIRNESGVGPKQGTQLSHFEDTRNTLSELTQFRLDIVEQEHEGRLLALYQSLSQGLLSQGGVSKPRKGHLAAVMVDAILVKRMLKETGTALVFCNKQYRLAYELFFNEICGCRCPYEVLRFRLRGKGAFTPNPRKFSDAIIEVLVYHRSDKFTFNPGHGIAGESPKPKSFPYLWKGEPCRFLPMLKKGIKNPIHYTLVVDGQTFDGPFFCSEARAKRLLKAGLITLRENRQKQLGPYIVELQIDANLNPGSSDGLFLAGTHFQRDKNPVITTQKPEDMLRILVETYAPEKGALVCDPYAGSGSTGTVCLETDRHVLLVEVDTQKADAIRARLLSTKPDASIGVDVFPTDTTSAQALGRLDPIAYQNYRTRRYGAGGKATAGRDGGIDGWLHVLNPEPGQTGKVALHVTTVENPRNKWNEIRTHLEDGRYDYALLLLAHDCPVSLLEDIYTYDRRNTRVVGGAEYPIVQVVTDRDEYGGVRPKLPPVREKWTLKTPAVPLHREADCLDICNYDAGII